MSLAGLLFLLEARSLVAQGRINGWMDPPEPSRAPLFQGEHLPLPPMQNEPWLAPPIDLPTNYLSASKVLFDQGLADPRDCDYREIEVGMASVWGMDGGLPTNGLLKTRGWVLPEATGTRFAVCWNGLVYPVLKIGAKANLKTDIANLVTNGVLPRGGTGFFESSALSPTSRLGIKGCLLLRLGEAESARVLWQTQARLKQEPALRWSVLRTNGLPGLSETKLPEADPYVDWAIEWTWALFDRTTYAFMRGDDGIAISGCRALSTMLTAVESEADRRGFARPDYSFYVPHRWSGHHLYFLEPVAALLVDEERRVARGRRSMSNNAGAADVTNQPRIAALISALEDIAIVPGSWRDNKTVAALVAEGADVVEPLAASLERDGTNLTRSISVGQNRHEGFTRERGIHTVAEPVCAILREVMQTSSFDLWATTTNELAAAGTNANRLTAIKARAYWRKFKDVPVEERWYQSLVDPNAGDSVWMDAINNIVSPIPWSRQYTNRPLPMRGETLRSKTNPSVTELMLQIGERQQVPGISGRNSGYPGYTDRFALAGYADYALTVAKWDASGSVLLLRSRMMKMLESWAACMRVSSPPHTEYPVDVTSAIVARNILQLTLARGKAGDEAALNSYLKWLSTMPSERFAKWLQENPFAGPDLFKPIWLYRDKPGVTNAARLIFDPQTSTLAPFLSLTNGRSSIVVQEAGTRLSTVAQFQPLLLQALTNRDILGKASVSTNGWVTVDNGGWLDSPPDWSICSPNQSVDYRICDYVAWQLSRWEGMPKIALFWHERQRDEAVIASAQRLERFKGTLGKQKRNRLHAHSATPEDEE